jgi:hypothetical protein
MKHWQRLPRVKNRAGFRYFSAVTVNALPSYRKAGRADHWHGRLDATHQGFSSLAHRVGTSVRGSSCRSIQLYLDRRLLDELAAHSDHSFLQRRQRWSRARQAIGRRLGARGLKRGGEALGRAGIWLWSQSARPPGRAGRCHQGPILGVELQSRRGRRSVAISRPRCIPSFLT